MKRRAKTPIRSAIAKRLILALILLTTVSAGQTFDLLTAKASDKVAQSLYFSVDSAKILNTYRTSDFVSPIARIQDSLFVVAAIQNAVSGTKNASSDFPKMFTLEQNYPNPFNPTTTIQFEIGKRAKVSVVLFDATGKIVASLLNEQKEVGVHTLRWDGRNGNGVSVSSGTYFYRLIASADDGTRFVETKGMTLVR